MLYVHVSAGAVDHGPAPLPRDWRHVSSLDALSDEELAPLGWHPCPGAAPAWDPAWQTRSGPVAVPDGDGWRAEWTVEDRPLDEVKAERLQAVRDEAGARILAFAPLYRQANTMRALYGEDDAAREDAVQLFDRIDAIRAACDAAEEDILAATAAEAAASVTADWPE